MSIKIEAKKVNFSELIAHDGLNAQIKYELLNINVEDILRSFIECYYYSLGEESIKRLKFNIYAHISIFNSEENKDTKENAVIFVKKEVEEKLQEELEYLRSFYIKRSVIKKFILKRDINAIKEKSKLIRDLLKKLKTMSLLDFESNFIIDNKNYDEKSVFMIPNYDYKPIKVYVSEDKVEVKKGYLFPIETNVYGGFKDKEGISRIDFQYNLSLNKEEVYISVSRENDGMFYFKPRMSSLLFFEDKETAIKIVEENLNKFWKKLKKVKKLKNDVNF